jgi:hypothetical protein
MFKIMRIFLKILLSVSSTNKQIHDVGKTEDYQLKERNGRHNRRRKPSGGCLGYASVFLVSSFGASGKRSLMPSGLGTWHFLIISVKRGNAFKCSLTVFLKRP